MKIMILQLYPENDLLIMTYNHGQERIIRKMKPNQLDTHLRGWSVDIIISNYDIPPKTLYPVVMPCLAAHQGVYIRWDKDPTKRVVEG